MQAGRRVNRLAVDSDLKMQMRAGRGARRTDRPDCLPARDGLPVCDIYRRKMAVPGRVTAAVIDRDVVAVAAVTLRHNNGSAGSRRYGRAGRGRDIQPLMEVGRAAERVRTPAERRGDRSRHGPGKGPDRAARGDAAARDSVGPARGFQLALAFDDQRFELSLLGCGKVFDLRDLRGYVPPLLGRDGYQILTLVRQSAQLIVRALLILLLAL